MSSRRFFHPYPFDRPRLFLVFTLMVASHRIVRGMLRFLPNYAFVLLLAQAPGEPVIGFGAVRMVARRKAAPWAKFGFMVAEGQQGRGIGTRIARAMYESAVALGVRTGGGTMLVDNGPSRVLAERFGFRFSVSAEQDPAVPGRAVLQSRSDLDAVLAYGPAPRPIPPGRSSPSGPSGPGMERSSAGEPDGA